MAKKTSTTRTKTNKQAAPKAPAGSRSTSAKKTTKKSPAKKSASQVASKKMTKKKVATKKTTIRKSSVAKKPPAGGKKKITKASKKASTAVKSTKSSARKKATTSSGGVKKTGKKKKVTSTKAAGTTAKKTTRKVSRKKLATKQASPKGTVKKKVARKKVAAKKSEPTPKASAAPKTAPEAPKSGRKGITVVPEKPKRTMRSTRKKVVVIRRPTGSQLLGPGTPKRSPLIPSGPKAAKRNANGDAASDRVTKSPFKKRELDKFRMLLIMKRRALVGDVSQLETEAFQSGSGGSSNTPQHMAEQGSDSADQTLSLGLAAADRRTIKEIDDALLRIDDGVFGICELTGKPIQAARLKEIPWARYSIEAAREHERRSFNGNW